MPNNVLMRQHQMHNMFATSNGYAERHMQRQMQDKNKRVMFLRKQRQLQITRDKQKRDKQNRVKYTQNSIQMNLGIRDAYIPNTKGKILIDGNKKIHLCDFEQTSINYHLDCDRNYNKTKTPTETPPTETTPIETTPTETMPIETTRTLNPDESAKT